MTNLQHGSISQSLGKLRKDTRNKVRAVVAAREKQAIKIFNKLRASCSGRELVNVDTAIRSLSHKESILPPLFSDKPQTREYYRRLISLDCTKNLEFVDGLTELHFEKVSGLINAISDLNTEILKSDFVSADSSIGQITSEYGYSHLVIRKAVMLKSLVSDRLKLDNTDNITNLSGLTKNNHMVSTLFHCYQEEQDFLSIKRSVMNTRDLGDWNRYSRDMMRLAFYPFAKDSTELSEILQSNLQSSLIDAILFLKANSRSFNETAYPSLFAAFELLNTASPNIDDISQLYKFFDEPEDLFYQQSSAWLENNDVVKFRLLPDHFYDDPDADYFFVDDDLKEELDDWVAVSRLEELTCDGNILTNHKFNNLKTIESSGTITRSSIFNFLVYRTKGQTNIPENELVKLMALTSGLARTVNTEYLKILALNSESDITKIILFLLIAKKSKNEADDHNLRRILQKEVRKNHNGVLVDFIDGIGERSDVIARYAYQVCTEDFIARLSHLIKTSQEITETRASLHEWMGDFTNESVYHDKARNLRIDHKINLVKDELDDHRIYVDTARFREWMEQEIEQELSTLLLILEHNNEFTSSDPQFLSLLDRCYSAFCENRFFGIASYLGRRIRHGTFKGHLYSDVINSIERKYEQIFMDHAVNQRWEEWKSEYENTIDTIVREKLHIKSNKKENGFLIPRIKSGQQEEIASACFKNILRDFQSNRQTYNSLTLITEYCWRLAEIDLKAINSYLKNHTPSLLNPELIQIIKNTCMDSQISNDFARDLQRLINEKLVTMYGWFKRPQSVSPKTALGLLYKAVVAEVNQTFKEFEPDTSISEKENIEIMGGAYHVLYDALYVIIFNAAKHGTDEGITHRSFKKIREEDKSEIEISISSKTNQPDELVNSKLRISPYDDIDNAQLNEGESGIRKLYHLQKYDKYFHIRDIRCNDGTVEVKISYELIYV